MHPEMSKYRNSNYNLIGSDYRTLAYQVSKFNPVFPPTMVYFPSIVLFIKMLDSCLIGPEKHHVGSIEDLLLNYI